MTHTTQIELILVVLVALPVGWLISSMLGDKPDPRKDILLKLAEMLGFSFVPKSDEDSSYNFSSPALPQDFTHQAYNVLCGQYKGADWRIFDYWFIERKGQPWKKRTVIIATNRDYKLIRDERSTGDMRGSVQGFFELPEMVPLKDEYRLHIKMEAHDMVVYSQEKIIRVEDIRLLLEAMAVRY